MQPDETSGKDKHCGHSVYFFARNSSEMISSWVNKLIYHVSASTLEQNCCSKLFEVGVEEDS